MIVLTGVTYFPVQAQEKNDARDITETKTLTAFQGPNSIVRTIKKGRMGNIWIASWEAIFKYDGKTFMNITSRVSSVQQ